ncbi:hypothetical protein L9F63_013763, partial [Diploptera punctata]
MKQLLVYIYKDRNRIESVPCTASAFECFYWNYNLIFSDPNQLEMISDNLLISEPVIFKHLGTLFNIDYNKTYSYNFKTMQHKCQQLVIFRRGAPDSSF